MNSHTRLSIAALISGALLIPPTSGHVTSAHDTNAGHVAPPYSNSAHR